MWANHVIGLSAFPHDSALSTSDSSAVTRTVQDRPSPCLTRVTHERSPVAS